MANRTSNQLPLNLPQLQNLIKRDSESYQAEFLQQRDHFLAVYDAFLQYNDLRSSQYNEDLDKLITFLAQVAHCYPDHLTDFPQKLISCLEQHAWEMHPDNRMSLCRTLILLRNKNLLEPQDILPLFFKLFQCPDKRLRKCLQLNIIADIKNLNTKRRNNRLNTYLQNFMFQMVSNSHAKSAKISLNIMIDLYHKNIWNDAKCVNVIAQACLSRVPSVMLTAIQFFLTNEKTEENDSDSDDDLPDAKQVMMAARVNKKSKKRQKTVEKVKTLIKKKKKKRKQESYSFSALHLIYDPQGFAEKLFKQMTTQHDQFEGKLLTLELVSRLIGVHELLLLNFYPYVNRFLKPHQREVTRILTCVAQASHELVPPESMEACIKEIVNNFVTERNSSDVMAVGLNAIREICVRCPLGMTKDLMQDLAEYKTYKDKSVMMAARSLIHVCRDVNPDMLKKKDKGKLTIAGMERKQRGYGERNVVELIPGAEVLIGKNGEKEESEAINDEDDDSSEGEWVDVSAEEDEDASGDEEEDEDGDEDDDDGEEEEEEVEGEEKEKPKEEEMDPQMRRQKALELMQTQILTDEDFQRMDKLQMQKQIVGAKKGSAKKRKAAEAMDNVNKQIDELVDLSAIENIHKKRRHDREARLETVKEGQKDREKFGKKKGRMNPFASTTNKEKRKSKNFMMLKPKLKRKGKSSLQERQRSFKHWLEKTRKRMLKIK